MFREDCTRLVASSNPVRQALLLLRGLCKWVIAEPLSRGEGTHNGESAESRGGGTHRACDALDRGPHDLDPFPSSPFRPSRMLKLGAEEFSVLAGAFCH